MDSPGVPLDNNQPLEAPVEAEAPEAAKAASVEEVTEV